MRCLILVLALLPAPLAAQDRPGLYLSGDARMGISTARPDRPGADRAGARLIARSRLRMTVVGETDGGLRFGAQIEFDTDDARLRRVTIGR